VLTRLIFGEGLTTGALFLELLIAGAIVVLAGSRLTRLADRLAEEYNLGRAWVGMLLLATVTSLPEVVTCCTAVAIDAADMAYATLFGSCSFNITLIACFNIAVVWFKIGPARGSILEGRKSAHSMTSTRGILMMALALLGIALTEKFEETNLRLAQGCEIVICVLIAVAYLRSIRISFQMEHGEAAAAEEPTLLPAKRTPGMIRKITLLSIVLVAAAYWLAQTGDVLQTHPIGLIGRPLGATAVGAIFLAIASSLPEIVTGLAAVRLGQIDLALGNIFGSNMFNIFVIPMCKIVSVLTGAPLLMGGGDFHAQQNIITGLLPILLTAIALGGLTFASKRRVLGLGPDSVTIAVFYLAGMILLLLSP
jgi:cation:H+ antiporter